MEFDKTELIGVIAALAAVVAALWRLHVSNSKREQERLARCEALHQESQKKVVDLTGDYRELKGRMDGVEKLSLTVLEEIRGKGN